MGPALSCPSREPPGADPAAPRDTAAGREEPDAAASRIEKLPEGYCAMAWQCVVDLTPIAMANTMQWYEFGVYSSMTPWLSTLFFDGSQTAAWLGFGVTYVIRPIGGVGFGMVADRCGRRPAVLAALGAMTGATVAQGLCPTRRVLGPVCLIFCRCLQGLATGGEIGSVAVFASESAPRAVLGMVNVPLAVSCTLGGVLSQALTVMLISFIPPEQMLVWGWRVPFLAAAAPGMWALYSAAQLEETPDFREVMDQGAKGASAAEGFEGSLADIWLPGAITCAGLASSFAQFSLIGTHLALWLEQHGLATRRVAYSYVAAAQLGSLLWVVPCSVAADAFGLATVNAASSALALTLSLPMYVLPLTYPASSVALFVSAFLIPSLTLGTWITDPWVVDLFPAEVRGRGVAISYSCAGLVGGLAPLACSLVPDPLFPGYYSAACALVSTSAALTALWLHREHRRTGEGPRVGYLRDEPY